MIKRVIVAATVLIIAGFLVIVSASLMPGIDKEVKERSPTTTYSIFE